MEDTSSINIYNILEPLFGIFFGCCTRTQLSASAFIRVDISESVDLQLLRSSPEIKSAADSLDFVGKNAENDGKPLRN